MGLGGGSCWLRRFGILPVAAALVLVPAAGSASADKGRWSIVYLQEEVTLPSGSSSDPSIKSVTIRCPKGFKLVGAGRYVFTIGYPNAALEEAKGPAVYYVQFRNSGSSQTWVAWANCARVTTATKPPKPVSLPDPRVVEKTVTLKPAEHTEVTTSCPGGTYPVWAGLEVPADPQNDPPGGVGPVETQSSRPTMDGSGWYQRFFWDDALAYEQRRTRQAMTRTLCFPTRAKIPAQKAKPKTKRKPSAAPRAVLLRFRQVSASAELTETGTTWLKAACKAGEPAFGGGYELSGPADFLGTKVRGRSFSAGYEVERVPIKPAQVTVVAICLPKRIA